MIGQYEHLVGKAYEQHKEVARSFTAAMKKKGAKITRGGCSMTIVEEYRTSKGRRAVKAVKDENLLSAEAFVKKHMTEDMRNAGIGTYWDQLQDMTLEDYRDLLAERVIGYEYDNDPQSLSRDELKELMEEDLKKRAKGYKELASMGQTKLGSDCKIYFKDKTPYYYLRWDECFFECIDSRNYDDNTFALFTAIPSEITAKLYNFTINHDTGATVDIEGEKWVYLKRYYPQPNVRCGGVGSFYFVRRNEYGCKELIRIANQWSASNNDMVKSIGYVKPHGCYWFLGNVRDSNKLEFTLEYSEEFDCDYFNGDPIACDKDIQHTEYKTTLYGGKAKFIDFQQNGDVAHEIMKGGV